MQKDLAVTNAAVRLLHEQKRDDESRQLQRSLITRSETSFSQPWQADLIERQMRETERRRHEVGRTVKYEPRRAMVRSNGVLGLRQPAPGVHSRIEEDLSAARDQNRVLQTELVRVRQEKAALEAEALAFKQRMETAVTSFEGIIEQAVEEKTRTFQQLLTAKQQLHTAQHQLRCAVPSGRPRLAAVLRRLVAMLDRTDESGALHTWRCFIRSEAERSQADRLARHEASSEHAITALKRRHAAEARELSAQLEREIEALTSSLEEQRGTVAQLQERGEAAERAHAAMQTELAATQTKLSVATASLQEMIGSSNVPKLRQRLAEVEGLLAAALRRAEDTSATAAHRANSKEMLARRMLGEQADQVAEAYSMSAAFKLLAAVGSRSHVAAARAVGVWRAACVALSAQQLSQAAAVREEQLRAEADASGQRASSATEAAEEMGRRLRELEGERAAAEQRTGAVGPAGEAAPASVPVGVGSTLKSKEGVMRKIIMDQQEQLQEGYRMSAAYKVLAAMGEGHLLTAAHAFTAWRFACALLSATEAAERASDAATATQAELRAELGRRTAESRDAADALRERVAELQRTTAELESRLEGERQRAAGAAAAAAAMLAAAQDGLLAERERAAAERERAAAERERAAAERERERSEELGTRLSAAGPTSSRAVGTRLSAAEPTSSRTVFQLQLARRMLHEQQEQLREAFCTTAGLKILAAVRGRHDVGLLSALAAWRTACARLRLAEVEATGGARQDLHAMDGSIAEHQVIALEETTARAIPRALRGADAVVLSERLATSWGSDVMAVRLEAAQRMLHEQQEELAESYGLAAGYRLDGIFSRRRAVALAHAFGAWRATPWTLGVEDRLVAASSGVLESGLRGEVPGYEVFQDAMAQVEVLQEQLQRTERGAQLSPAGADSSHAKMHVLQRMLHDQQEELHEAYRLSAGCKLLATLSTRKAMAMAHAVAAWRAACMQISANGQRSRSANGPWSGAVDAQAVVVGLQGNLATLQAMLHDQQEELLDSYRLSAGCKLLTVLSQRRSLALARAMAAWSRACWGRAQPGL
jgi:hypothetical protein